MLYPTRFVRTNVSCVVCANTKQLQELVAIAAASLASQIANEDKEIVLDELEIFKVIICTCNGHRDSVTD